MDVESPQPPGGELAEFVVSALRDSRIQVEGPDNREDWAWDIVGHVSGKEICCVLGAVDDGPRQWLVITHAWAGVLGWLRRESTLEPHLAFCRALDRVLKQDSRFRSIRWYSPEEWDGPGDSWGTTPGSTGPTT